jgi:hypothetical protein
VLGPNDLLIGISGNVDDALPLQAKLSRGGAAAAVLDPLKLPANFSGYDGISALILDAPDFAALKLEQEQAIVQWVAGGGNLLVIPPATLIPSRDPIVDALPCEIGVNQSASVSAEGATTRPIALNGRLLRPRPGASAFGVAGQAGYLRWLGLGKIAVVPVNVSPLNFSDATAANVFWRALLKPLVELPAMKPPTSMAVAEEEQTVVAGPNAADTFGRGPRESRAIRHVLEMMRADQPSRGGGWGSVLLGAAGIFFLLGPIDSIVLMRLGQRPRNLLTLVGWLAMLGCIGGVVFANVHRGEATASTFRLIDQADDAAVAATDVLAIRSTSAVSAKLSLNESEWWEPANQAARSFSPDRFVDAQFHEDKTGCRPELASLNGAWPLSWHGELASPGPAALRAALHLDGSHLTGTLTNLSGSSMTEIQIVTAAGNFHVSQTLPAGGSLAINLQADRNPIAFTDLPADVGDISPERADRVDERVREGQACVLAAMPDAAAVAPGVAVESHAQLLRAVASLGK